MQMWHSLYFLVPPLRNVHGHAAGQRECRRRAAGGALQSEGGVQHVPRPHRTRLPDLPLRAAVSEALLRGPVPPGPACDVLLRVAALLLHQPRTAREHPEDQWERYSAVVSALVVLGCLELLE